MTSVCTQILLCEPGLELCSQSTCIVSLVFFTKGNSTSNHSIASLNSSEHPYSPLCVTHSRASLIHFLSLSLSLLLSYFFSPKLLTPSFSFSSPFYSFMLVEASWLFLQLTCVGGVQSNYSWWKYTLIEMVVMALELTPASKRPLSSDIP